MHVRQPSCKDDWRHHPNGVTNRGPGHREIPPDQPRRPQTMTRGDWWGSTGPMLDNGDRGDQRSSGGARSARFGPPGGPTRDLTRRAAVASTCVFRRQPTTIPISADQRSEGLDRSLRHLRLSGGARGRQGSPSAPRAALGAALGGLDPPLRSAPDRSCRRGRKEGWSGSVGMVVEPSEWVVGFVGIRSRPARRW